MTPEEETKAQEIYKAFQRKHGSQGGKRTYQLHGKAHYKKMNELRWKKKKA